MRMEKATIVIEGCLMQEYQRGSLVAISQSHIRKQKLTLSLKPREMGGGGGRGHFMLGCTVALSALRAAGCAACHVARWR